MTDIGPLLAALTAESDDLDGLVATLEPGRWATPTPAEGWTVAHQISHLAWTDQQAIIAATDPGAFASALAEAVVDPEGHVAAGADEGAGEEPDRLLERWRAGRSKLADTLAAVELLRPSKSSACSNLPT